MKSSDYWKGWKDCASDLLDVALEASITPDFTKQIEDYAAFATKQLGSDAEEGADGDAV